MHVKTLVGDRVRLCQAFFSCVIMKFLKPLHCLTLATCFNIL